MFYNPSVLTSIRYYPFGMPMPGRSNNIDHYRYGYNGMEMDNDVRSSNGNSYTTEFRQYDPRLGRWLSLDPLMNQFPWMSPYVAFNDNPVLYNDPYGQAAGPGGPPEDIECLEVGDMSSDGEHYVDVDNSGHKVWGKLLNLDVEVNACKQLAKQAASLACDNPGDAVDIGIQAISGISGLGLEMYGGTNQYTVPNATQMAIIRYDELCVMKPLREAWAEIKGVVHDAMDALSLVPVIGDVGDIINTILYTAEGDWVAAGASGGSIVLGSSALSVPIARKVASEVVEEAEEQVIKEVTEEVVEDAVSKPYSKSRPKYGKNQVENVWENAKQGDGNVYDPNTGEIITWDKNKPRNGQWDMGHTPGNEYRKLRQDYLDGKISKKEFLRRYRESKNYKPELPKNNRSHKFEQK